MTSETAKMEDPFQKDDFPFQLIAATHAYADARTPVIERSDYKACTIEYVIRGAGVLKINGKSFAPGTDSIYFLTKWSDHCYAPNREDPWHKLFFVIDGELMVSLLKAYRLDEVYYFPDCPQLKHFFEDMMALNPNSETVNQQSALLFHQFVNELARVTYGTPSVYPPEVEALKEKLDASMTTGFNLVEYAKKSEYSEAHLIRIFRNAFGVTPYDYLMSKKMELAKRLLLYSSFSIKEIAAHLSFSDQYYFSNFFKMKTGLSPRNYKMKYIGKGKNE